MVNSATSEHRILILRDRIVKMIDASSKGKPWWRLLTKYLYFTLLPIPSSSTRFAFAGLLILAALVGSMKHFYSSLALACLLASTLWAADDPFLGKWKLNMEKSKLTGEQTKIEELGGSKYKWASGNVTNTYTNDGTDQPSQFGNTVAITPVDANNWKMVIKKDGRVLSSMTHTLSADGKTQTIKGTGNKPTAQPTILRL